MSFSVPGHPSHSLASKVIGSIVTGSTAIGSASIDKGWLTWSTRLGADRSVSGESHVWISFLLLVVRPGAPSSFLLLVAMPLLLVASCY